MAGKNDVADWVVAALRRLGGRGSVVDVAREIWASHSEELIHSGNLLYTWQYDMRWSANGLRRKGLMKPVERSPRGTWELQ